MKKLTIQDKILLAAGELHSKGKSRFSAEDLVVSSWRLFPDAFSLLGYDLPNSNRVFAEIMGTKPLRKLGLIKKVGEKLYMLSEAGLIKFQFLSGASLSKNEEKLNVSRDLSNRIKNLLEARASQKFRQGREDDITFSDACVFWGITPRSSAIECEGALNGLDQVLSTISEIVGTSAKRFTHDGPMITNFDIEKLVSVHEFMKERFEHDLFIIRQRRDERI